MSHRVLCNELPRTGALPGWTATCCGEYKQFVWLIAGMLSSRYAAFRTFSEIQPSGDASPAKDVCVDATPSTGRPQRSRNNLDYRMTPGG
jgi:hypothetical protein